MCGHVHAITKAFLAYFSLDMLFLSGRVFFVALFFLFFFVFLGGRVAILSILYLCDVSCFVLYILLLKELPHGDNKPVYICACPQYWTQAWDMSLKNKSAKKRKEKKKREKNNMQNRLFSVELRHVPTQYKY